MTLNEKTRDGVPAGQPLTIETIAFDGTVYAIILRHDHSSRGIEFFTPPAYSQQLAYMHHPTGHTIDPHVHNLVVREVAYTQEVLVIRRGTLRVDFYDNDRCYRESHLLHGGDVILLASGGHGFQVIEELEMIEIKQGPYAGDGDKTRFDAAPPDRIRLKLP